MDKKMKIRGERGNPGTEKTRRLLDRKIQEAAGSGGINR
jgi:hypothetical protein